MPDVVVTFTSAVKSLVGPLIVPLEIGRRARTATVAIGATSAQASNEAEPGEGIVSLLIEADCWIAIGQNPTAVAGSGRKLLAGERVQYSVIKGDKVACIEV